MVYPILDMFLSQSARKESDKYENLGKYNTLNCIEIIVENGAFVRLMQMLHFLLCFQ